MAFVWATEQKEVDDGSEQKWISKRKENISGWDTL